MRPSTPHTITLQPSSFRNLRLPKRLRVIYFLARTRLAQRLIMVPATPALPSESQHSVPSGLLHFALEVGDAPQALMAPGSLALGSRPPYPPAQILVASELISLSLGEAAPGAWGRRVIISLEGPRTRAWLMGCSRMELPWFPEPGFPCHTVCRTQKMLAESFTCWAGRKGRSRAGSWPAVAPPWSCRERERA